MSKRKIFILSPGPNYNLEFTFRERCEELSDRFKGVVLTSGSTFKRDTYGEFTILRIMDPLTKSFLSVIGFIAVGVFLLFKAIITRERYELFVTYDPLKTGLIGLFLAFIFRIRLLVEVNGDYTNDANYHEIKSLFKKKIKKFCMIKIEKFVLDRASGVKLLYANQIDSFLPLSNNAEVDHFQDFVNSEAFTNLDDKPEILLAGYPFWVKGVDIATAAFSRIADKHKDWKLKIMGYCPDKEILKEFIGNHPQIFYHPPVDRSEMPKHIGRCGIFVLPSRTEAMGRVLIESMAAGKPRIGSNVGGIPTVIHHNVDGLLFESENIDALADQLDKLINDPDLRHSLGKAARTRYEAEFRPVMYFERLKTFYGKVLDRK